jgi:hypothetical protein
VPEYVDFCEELETLPVTKARDSIRDEVEDLILRTG